MLALKILSLNFYLWQIRETERQRDRETERQRGRDTETQRERETKKKNIKQVYQVSHLISNKLLFVDSKISFLKIILIYYIRRYLTFQLK